MKPTKNLAFIYAISLLHFILTGCLGGGESAGFLDAMKSGGTPSVPKGSSGIDCQDGLIYTPDGCKEVICGASDIYTEDCSGGDPFSSATITAICNKYGTELDVGACSNSCVSGYVFENDKCTQVICEANSNEIIACDPLILNATGMVNVTCSENGTTKVPGICNFNGCKDGFVEINGRCLESICKAGEDSPFISEICYPAVGAVGTVRPVCNATGTAYDQAGNCKFDKCQDGYANIAGTCVTKTCDATYPSINEESCNFGIEGSIGKRYQVCNSFGTAYDSYTACEFVGCNDGYLQEGNSCILEPKNKCEAGYVFVESENVCKKLICTPNVVTGERVACAGDQNGANYEQTLICNEDGTGTKAGDCTFKNCKGDFVLVADNKCEAKICEAGIIDAALGVACDFNSDGAIGVKQLICNTLGTGFDYGACEFNGCKPDFTNVNGECKKSCEGVAHGRYDVEKVVFESASPDFGVACKEVKQTRLCNNGIWSDWTNIQFTAMTCRVKDCLPESVSEKMCETEAYLPGTVAMEIWTCNANGIYDKGACQVVGCDEGYEFVSGNCQLPLTYKLVEDAFKQRAETEARKLDVIWVIDNSGSMRADQTHVVNNIKLFADSVLADGSVDVRMGITTTDTNPRYRECVHKIQGCNKTVTGWANGNSGQRSFHNNYGQFGGFVGRVVEINSKMNDATKLGEIAEFKKQVAGIGTKGSGNEKGLEAIKLTQLASANLYADPNSADYFYRKDALLVYIVVSDEDDSSDITPSVLVNSFAGDMKGARIYSIVHTEQAKCLKQEKLNLIPHVPFVRTRATQYLKQGKLNLIPHVPFVRTGATQYLKQGRSGCSNWSYSVGEPMGEAYIEASGLTGGKSYSIDEDFSNHLSNLGETVTVLLSTFPLSLIPADMNDVVVLVNGDRAQDAGYNYRYNADNNNIEFIGETLPPVGSEIVVKYKVAK